MQKTPGLQRVSEPIGPVQLADAGRVRPHGRPPDIDFRQRRVHLIGIGGSGMRGAAGVLLQCGARVSGSEAGAGPR